MILIHFGWIISLKTILLVNAGESLTASTASPPGSGSSLILITAVIGGSIVLLSLGCLIFAVILIRKRNNMRLLENVGGSQASTKKTAESSLKIISKILDNGDPSRNEWSEIVKRHGGKSDSKHSRKNAFYQPDTNGSEEFSSPSNEQATNENQSNDGFSKFDPAEEKNVTESALENIPEDPPPNESQGFPEHLSSDRDSKISNKKKASDITYTEMPPEPVARPVESVSAHIFLEQRDSSKDSQSNSNFNTSQKIQNEATTNHFLGSNPANKPVETAEENEGYRSLEYPEGGEEENGHANNIPDIPFADRISEFGQENAGLTDGNEPSDGLRDSMASRVTEKAKPPETSQSPSQPNNSSKGQPPPQVGTIQEAFHNDVDETEKVLPNFRPNLVNQVNPMKYDTLNGDAEFVYPESDYSDQFQQQGHPNFADDQNQMYYYNNGQQFNDYADGPSPNGESRNTASLQRSKTGTGPNRWSPMNSNRPVYQNQYSNDQYVPYGYGQTGNYANYSNYSMPQNFQGQLNYNMRPVSYIRPTPNPANRSFNIIAVNPKPFTPARPPPLTPRPAGLPQSYGPRSMGPRPNQYMRPQQILPFSQQPSISFTPQKQPNMPNMANNKTLIEEAVDSVSNYGNPQGNTNRNNSTLIDEATMQPARYMGPPQGY